MKKGCFLNMKKAGDAMENKDPTLYIGIGGTGKKVIDGLAQRVRNNEAPVYMIDIDSEKKNEGSEEK